MSEQKKETVKLELTRQEANVVLRALATHNEADNTPAIDRPACTWVAQRLLQLLQPDLGHDPINALFEKAGE